MRIDRAASTRRRCGRVVSIRALGLSPNQGHRMLGLGGRRTSTPGRSGRTPPKRPGARAEANLRKGGREFPFVWDVRPNAVWRFGRVFLRCPRCDGRVTRLYVPTADVWIACRRCWGLSDPSQKQSYVSGGLLGEILGSWGKSGTGSARKRRRVAAQKRYADRQEILSRLR
jgi:hypothetical protein